MWKELVQLIHLLFMLFMIVGALSNNIVLNLLVAIILPFLLLHWYMNNDVCALTELEKYLTKKKTDETYFGTLINPVYRIKSRNMHMITWVLIII